MPAKPAPRTRPQPPPVITVNGIQHKPPASELEMPLIYWLRGDLGLTGTHLGCGQGECGACTILLDGQPARACTTSLAQAVGRTVTTVEGLGSPDSPHPVQAAFIATQAAQCGFCTPGLVVETAALLAANPHPNREETKTALEGHLCRCGSHARVLDAVASLAKEGRPS